MRLVLGLSVALASSSSWALENKDHNFFCTTEATGGLSYSAQTQKWESTRFKPEGNFILKMKYVRTFTEKDKWNLTEIVISEYIVTLTEAGTKKDIGCSNDPRVLPVQVRYDELRCSSWDLHDNRFNFETNRFLRIYPIGYINGKDDNSNTPMIAAGTCTRIN